MSGPKVTVEVHFAQRLANNEKTIRDKTIKKLRLWMTVRSKSGKHVFTEEDFLKLWKGLFYCMWMCDKALVQEELADNIAKLVHKLHTKESALMFFKTFLKTMEREWHGIDRLRMDKFYMFIRRIFREQLEYLKNQQWNRQSIGALLEILKQGPLNGINPTKATGLLHHIADIYLEELTRVGATELSPQETLLFLDPFITLISQTKNKSLMKTLLREIFEDIMVHSSVGMEEVIEQEKMMKQKSENEENESGEEDASLAFDYSAIADQLFTFGSQKDTPGLNRKKMYGMAQKFQDLARGIYPIPDLEELAQLSSDDEIEDDVKLKHKRKQKKKMREAKLKMKMEKDADNVVGEMNEGDEEKAKKEPMMNGTLHVKRKKKLKEKLGELEENEESRMKNEKVDRSIARKISKNERTLKDVDENKVEVIDIVKDNKKVKKCKKSRKLEELANKEDLEIEGDSEICNLKNDKMDKKKTKTAAKRKSESYIKQTEEPFAEFQAVSTPPAVVLKKRVEPATEVRSKKQPIKLTAPGSAPPSIKKHVKITLSKNTKHKQSDYQKQVKCSPGIPFDSTKKPTHSVLKRTQMTTPAKTTRSILKRTPMTTPTTKLKTKKRRSNASDFF